MRMTWIREYKELILSHSKERENYRKAVKEWDYQGSHDFKENNPDAFYPDDYPSCALCGQHPIREVCLIKNNETGEQLEIGNKCVKQFLPHRAEQVNKDIKKIKNNQKLKKNKIDFKTQSIYADYLALEKALPIPGYGHKRKQYDKIKETVEKIGKPTKNQLDKLKSIQESYLENFSEKELAKECFMLLKGPIDERSAGFVSDLLRFKKIDKGLSPKQVSWLDSLRKKYL